MLCALFDWQMPILATLDQKWKSIFSHKILTVHFIKLDMYL